MTRKVNNSHLNSKVATSCEEHHVSRELIPKIYGKQNPSVRLRVRARVVRVCARVCICMYDDYIILLYMRSQSVPMNVGTFACTYACAYAQRV